MATQLAGVTIGQTYEIDVIRKGKVVGSRKLNIISIPSTIKKLGNGDIALCYEVKWPNGSTQFVPRWMLLHALNMRPVR